MPTYDLPKLPAQPKAETAVNAVMPQGGDFPDLWDRQIRIPVNAAIVAALAVGEGAEITLRGKIIEITSNDHANGGGRKQIVLEIDQVSAYQADPADLGERDMDAGFQRGPRAINSRYKP